MNKILLDSRKTEVNFFILLNFYEQQTFVYLTLQKITGCKMANRGPKMLDQIIRNSSNAIIQSNGQ